MLLDHNANVNAVNNGGVTALTRATGKSKEILTTLFSEQHALEDHQNVPGGHPIDPTSSDEPSKKQEL